MKFIQIFFILFYSSFVYAQESGIKEIVKTHQDKIISVEKTLKTLIGKIENKKNNFNSDGLKKINDSISLISDKLKILDSKIQTLTDFSYRLEFEIKRLEAHLNLSSSYSKEKQPKEKTIPKKPELGDKNKPISKESLQTKSENVLGFIKEKNEKEKNRSQQPSIAQNKENKKALPKLNADEQFKKAKSFLAKRDYDKAEKAFQNFINKNKKHKNSADAHYWLGRIYYIQKKYSEAAIALAEFNTLYPDDKRLQETTLLIAESATNLLQKNKFVES